MRNKFPMTDPYRTAHFTVPHSDKKFWTSLAGSASTLCLLLARQNVNQSGAVP